MWGTVFVIESAFHLSFMFKVGFSINMQETRRSIAHISGVTIVYTKRCHSLVRDVVLHVMEQYSTLENPEWFQSPDLKLHTIINTIDKVHEWMFSIKRTLDTGQDHGKGTRIFPRTFANGVGVDRPRVTF